MSDLESVHKVHVVVAIEFVSTGKSARPFNGVCVFGPDFGSCCLRAELLRDSAEQKRDKVRLVRLSCFSAKDLVTKENPASHIASIGAKSRTNK